MASDKLQKILEMSKKIDKKATKLGQTQQKPIKPAVSLGDKIARADQAIANIDAAFTRPYIPTKEEVGKWNTERGREELTEMANNDVFLEKLSHSKLPSAIIESMRNNPCNYEASMVNGVMGPENALFKRLNEAYAKGEEKPVTGVKAVQQINEKLATRDKQEADSEKKINESTLNHTVDLSLLEQVIERVLDRKLGQLTESVHRNNAGIRSMSLTENGNFRFLDNEDNVYECQMKYIGKRKKKKTTPQ